MTEKIRCCEDVHDDFGVSFHQCIRYAKVERNGKHYCKTHDPEEVKRRGDARRAKWKAEDEASRMKSEQSVLNHPLIAQLTEALETVNRYRKYDNGISDLFGIVLRGDEGEEITVGEIVDAALAAARKL